MMDRGRPNRDRRDLHFTLLSSCDFPLFSLNSRYLERSWREKNMAEREIKNLLGKATVE